MKVSQGVIDGRRRGAAAREDKVGDNLQLQPHRGAPLSLGQGTAFAVGNWFAAAEGCGGIDVHVQEFSVYSNKSRSAHGGISV
jgi:hypothetical protein